MPSEPCRAPLPTWLFALAALGLAAVARAPALGAEWLGEDLYLLRRAEPVAEGLDGARRVLRAGLVHELKDGRSVSSLVMASLAVDGARARDGGVLVPGPFHATQFGLYLLATLLLFALLRRLAPRAPLLAAGAAFLFAIHPLGSAAATGLAGRGALLAVVFALLAGLARLHLHRSALLIPLVWLPGLLAMWAHPGALGLGVALWLLGRVPRAGSRPSAGREAAVLAVLLLAGLGLGLRLTGEDTVLAGHPDQGLATALGLGLVAVARLALAFFVPVGLPGAASDEVPATGVALAGAPAVLLVVAAGLGFVALLRGLGGRAGPGALCMGLLLALALPAALVLPAGALLDPRAAPLVWLPLCVVPPTLAGAARRAIPRRREGAVAVALGALLAGAALLGLARAEGRAWADEVARTQQVLDQQPRHLGALLRMARHERALAESLREEAARLRADDPRRPALTERRALALARALATARRATRHPDGRTQPGAWEEVGQALLALERVPEALDALGEALRLDPLLEQRSAAALREELTEARQVAAADFLRALARARAATGDPDGAADALAKAAGLAPADGALQEQAGLALWGVNRYPEALEHLLRALDLARTPADRRRRGEALERAREQARARAAESRREAEAHLAKGEIPAALRAFEAALRDDPGDVRALMQAGWWSGYWFGRYGDAHRMLDAADRLLVEQGKAADDPDRAWIREKRDQLRRQRAEEDAAARRDGDG